MTTMRNFAPVHFDWQWDAGIATVSLHGAARKNPLTFESMPSFGTCSANWPTPMMLTWWY